MCWAAVGWDILAGSPAEASSLLFPFSLKSTTLFFIGLHVTILILIGDSRAKRGKRQWHPTPVLLPGKSHGLRSLVGCGPWGRKESDMTGRLHFHFSLLCFGEGNGNPLQCSCLENPRDRGAWWAAVYGIAQNRTQLKRLSSSSRAKRGGKLLF